MLEAAFDEELSQRIDEIANLSNEIVTLKSTLEETMKSSKRKVQRTDSSIEFELLQSATKQVEVLNFSSLKAKRQPVVLSFKYAYHYDDTLLHCVFREKCHICCLYLYTYIKIHCRVTLALTKAEADNVIDFTENGDSRSFPIHCSMYFFL